MKRFPFFLFLLFNTVAFAQLIVPGNGFDSLMNRGKAEFKKEFSQQNYSAAIVNFKKAAVLYPESSEVHYFLGYAYSRLNAKDGEGIIKMKPELTKRCSEEMELVNALTPQYTGERIVLDPYSKLTAEWGSLAMRYWNNDKSDSAVWAFKEGKRRGGFGDFFLSINRYILSNCSKNAILMSSGDNFTIPLWYLQQVEGYRKDVVVIDINLLNTMWYPRLLRSKFTVSFDLLQSTIDTLGYKPWKDSTVSVRNKYAYKAFEWRVKPTIFEKYLQRSDQIFLSILAANEFEQDIFFTMGCDEKETLNLNDHLLSMIMLDKININNQPAYTFDRYKNDLDIVLKLIPSYINMNSADQVALVHAMRNDLLMRLQEYHQTGNTSAVKRLFKLLDNYIPEKSFPYSSKETKNYIDHLRKKY
ncbi:MAG TPA: hypothetical protein VK750_00450 [Cytophagaceae bacterium]|nr:hypothetical protein [Cytophagaceae bacterium]